MSRTPDDAQPAHGRHRSADQLIGELELAGISSRVLHLSEPSGLCAPLLHSPSGASEPSRTIDLIIADETTVKLLPAAAASIPRVVVPVGEACKTWSVLEQVLQACVGHGLTRDSVLAGFGGGAVTDLAAFAASIYLRGIDVVLIPTSLLAMVDAAVGGKTGIDFAGLKNLVGTFQPGREVRVYSGFVQSLPDREFRSGLAEVIKAACLAEPELFRLLESRRTDVLARDRSTIDELVRRAVAVKVDVVRRDYREQGVRATLNLGHTFAHALEACMGLGRITHGEAVAWGMARAARTSVRMELDRDSWASRVTGLLSAYGYDTGPLPPGIDRDCYLRALAHDKKARRDGLRFILQHGPQDTAPHRVHESVLTAILEEEGEILA